MITYKCRLCIIVVVVVVVVMMHDVVFNFLIKIKKGNYQKHTYNSTYTFVFRMVIGMFLLKRTPIHPLSSTVRKWLADQFLQRCIVLGYHPLCYWLSMTEVRQRLDTVSAHFGSEQRTVLVLND